MRRIVDSLRPARLNDQKEIRWARTTSDSPGSYPADGNTFEIVFLDSEFPASAGENDPTFADRSNPEDPNQGPQSWVHVHPTQYLPRDTVLQVFRQRGLRSDRGEWWAIPPQKCGPTSFTYFQQVEPWLSYDPLTAPFPIKIPFKRPDTLGTVNELYHNGAFWYADGVDLFSTKGGLGHPAHLVTGNFTLSAIASSGAGYLQYRVFFITGHLLDIDSYSLELAQGRVDVEDGGSRSLSIPLHGLIPAVASTEWANLTGYVQFQVLDDLNISTFGISYFKLSLHAQTTCLAPAWMIPRPLTDSNGNQLFDNDGNPLFGQFSPGGGGTQAPAGLNDPPE